MVGSGVKVVERKGLDSTVGGLVWVQRRNGSWWPGQIVGEEELPQPETAGPRSGTPIKLLGRDDTSVELYDLETTKIVKAFRCGEYDSCIKNAKVLAVKNARRSTKYPRKEVAVMQALEIEKASLSKGCPDSEAPLNCERGSASISHPSKDSEYSSEATSSEETTSTSEEDSTSTQELSHSGISYEETNGFAHRKGPQLRGRKRKTPYDSEDDGSEGIKRMKGLNDLGIGSERKHQVLALPNPIPQSSVSLNNIRAANCMSVGTLANGSSFSTLRKKRSQVVHIQELLKKKYRRRPLTKVLENSTMVPVHIICDEFANPFERSDAVSPSYECEDGNKVKDAELLNELLPEDDSSDMLFDVPFVDEELCLSGFSPAWQSSSPSKPYIGASRGNSIRNFQVQASSFGFEAQSQGGATYSASFVDQKVEKSASKWQSKGKRNVRYLSKAEEPYPRKKADIVYDKSDAYATGHENPGLFSSSSNGIINGFTDRRNHVAMASSQRSFPYHQSCYLVSSGFEIPDVSTRSGYADSLLYEVEVTVEATRPQAQHVPYISLMSKLNGKPITGHPVPVEVLEDEYLEPENSDYRASGSCELDDEDTEADFVVEPKPRRIKKVKVRHHSSRKRRSSKSKKRHGPSSKKTRKLSSLTGPQKLGMVKGKAMGQTSKGPILACVPLKVVFSRINEALNGSSRSAHRLGNT